MVTGPKNRASSDVPLIKAWAGAAKSDLSASADPHAFLFFLKKRGRSTRWCCSATLNVNVKYHCRRWLDHVAADHFKLETGDGRAGGLSPWTFSAPCTAALTYWTSRSMNEWNEDRRKVHRPKRNRSAGVGYGYSTKKQATWAETMPFRNE